MKEERIYQVLLAPHVTEKASLASSGNQVVFKVLKDSNKLEIKKSVERLFEVKVKSVTTSVVKGKAKRHGKSLGVRSDWKKAYVTLHEGFDINLLGAE
ncbi:MAG: 50S ribosomal protein L23 [Pseudomonadales bacterium]|nr:50S ribosomal protein L23 [Pseudomonadales bacterium]